MSDLDFIEGLEKAIQEKYGEAAVKDPRSTWNDEKEKDFLEQKKKLVETKEEYKKEKIESDGFIISRKLLNTKQNRTCPVCKHYSFNVKDDVFMKKYEVCHSCYIEHVEDREDKWQEKKEKLINDHG